MADQNNGANNNTNEQGNAGATNQAPNQAGASNPPATPTKDERSIWEKFDDKKKEFETKHPKLCAFGKGVAMFGAGAATAIVGLAAYGQYKEGQSVEDFSDMLNNDPDNSNIVDMPSDNK